MRATLTRACLALSSLLATNACRTPATQIELILGTDADPSRRVTLRIYSFAGTVATRDIAARVAAAPEPMRLISSDSNTRARDGLIGSVGLRPSMASANGEVTVVVRATFEADARSPTVTIDRIGRAGFVRETSGTTRVWLSLQCGDRALGCATVAPAACTVSVRCAEQGQTCGSAGVCIEPELPVEYPNDGGLDGGERPSDASSGRVVRAPQPIAPLSTSTVSASRPEFRWRNAPDVTSARVEICRDRACATVIERFDVVGDRGRPSRALPRGVALFWRLRGLATGTVSEDTSPVWQLRSRALDGAMATVSSGVEGDYNGDGRADLAVNIPGNAMFAFAPSVRVFSGSDVAPAAVLSGAVAEGYGSAVAPAGDVNGDGFGDLLVSETRVTDGAARRGQVLIYFGGPMGLSVSRAHSVLAPWTGVDFGEAAAGIGDFNGDGYGDIVVGTINGLAPPTGWAGDARVFTGSASGLSSTRSVVLSPIAGVDRHGGYANGAGDVDGDGLADVLVYGRRVGGGASVQLYRGDASRQQISAMTEFTLLAADTFGNVAIGGADFNGDGVSDLVITDWATRTARAHAGVFGAIPSPWGGELFSLAAGQTRFGTSVSLGDLNGDGRTDLVVGASHETPASGLPRAGVAHVYLAKTTEGFDPVTVPAIEGDVADGAFSWAVAMGDQDNDGRDDLCVGARAATVSMLNASGYVRCVSLAFTGVSATVTRTATINGPLSDGLFGSVISLGLSANAR